jgi:hypothetical protein
MGEPVDGPEVEQGPQVEQKSQQMGSEAPLRCAQQGQQQTELDAKNRQGKNTAGGLHKETTPVPLDEQRQLTDTQMEPQ